MLAATSLVPRHVRISATLRLPSQVPKALLITLISLVTLREEAHQVERLWFHLDLWILQLVRIKVGASEFPPLSVAVGFLSPVITHNIAFLTKWLGVGFKPTHGLVPWTGITSGDAVNDHAGPLAQSVLDAALCLDAIAGYDGIDDRSLGAGIHRSHGFADSLRSNTTLTGIKIGVMLEGFDHAMIHPNVRRVVSSAISGLKSLGATVKTVSIPSHLDGPAIWTIQQRIAGAMNILGRAHGRRGLHLTEFEHARLPWSVENFGKLFHSTKNTVINGLYLIDNFPGLYGKTMNLSRKVSDDYEKIFEDYDVLVMPTTPVVAPRHGDPNGTPFQCFEPSIGLTANTAIFNVTGHPAMSIPVGFAPAEDDPMVQLPVGMQIVGGLWQENKILKVGHAWENKFDWRALSVEADADSW